MAFMNEVQHEIVFFEGRVQGVGFRYTVLQLSKEFEASGFVGNLPDGRVHMELEGKKAEIDAFIDAIQDRMHGHIRRTERSSRHRPPEFAGFVIR
jgi:acylphosphatase